MNKGQIFFKELSDDQGDWIFDLMLRAVKKSSQCVSSTDKISERLGTECRIAINNVNLLDTELKAQDEI